MMRRCIKWLSVLLTVCLLLGAPAAMMEVAPEDDGAGLEEPVGEVSLELGDGPEAPAEDDKADEADEETVLVLGETESEPLDAEEAIYGESIPIDDAHFPDPGFRRLLTDPDEDYDVDHDGVFSPAEIREIGSVDIGESYDVHSVAGIEYFPNLRSLYCEGSQLQSLDVCNNAMLKSLNCARCGLPSLDVSQNKKLEHLYCYENALRSLDVTNNSELTSLWCFGNALTTLDVSRCPLLRTLECSYNSLESLDLRNNGKLERLTCMVNKLNGLDLGGNPKLIELHCDSNAIKTLDLRGLSSLLILDCNQNDLTSLLLGSMDALLEINCDTNHLASLDVSKCPALSTLRCSQNNLSTLNLSGLTLAQVVTNERKQDYGGWLSYESESQSWNGHFTLCVDVGTQVITDAAGSGLPIDAAHFPDANFRKYIQSTFDLSGDGQLSDKELARVREIDIRYGDTTDATARIASVKGVEYLTALEAFVYDSWGGPAPLFADFDLTKNANLIELRFYNVNLSGFDFSKYPNLKTLEAEYAGLTTLNVSKNKALVRLSCSGNSLATLDVSGLAALEELSCDNNKLDTLDVSKNKALRELYCVNNRLEALDISHNTLLEELNCNKNPISMLDLSHNSALLGLSFQGTKIAGIDISHLSELGDVGCIGTPMKTLDISGCPILVNTVKYIDPWKGFDDDYGVYVLDYVTGEGERTGGLSINQDLKLILNRENLAIDEANFPDANFRALLLMQGDLDGDLALSSAEIAAVDAIYCANSNIASLAGIEHLTALHILECEGNKLTELNISDCPALNRCYLEGDKREEGVAVRYGMGGDALKADKSVRIIADEVPTFALLRSTKHTMDMGTKLRLTLGSNTAANFKSSKDSVARVSADGVIEARAAGKATITVTLTNRKKLKLTLTVVDPTIPTGLKLDRTGTIQWDLNKKLQLTATLEKAGVATGGVTWKTRASKVATVDDNGLVTPLKTGKVTITATAKRNRKATAKVTLNIFDPYAVSAIVLDRTGTVTMDVQDTLTLAATLQPGTARSDITWKSSSEKIARVKDGVVTPVKTGSVTITATAVKNKKTARVKVVIKDLYAPKKITIDQGRRLTLKQGETITLTASVTGEKGITPRKRLTWTAANSKVTVDPVTGVVTAREPGKVKVTVTTDNKKKASITITVAK